MIKLSRRERWMLLLLALSGTLVCVVALIGFVFTIVHNNLDWYPEQTVRDYYLAVGQSYGEGFLIGFFLCFFLSLAAMAVAAGLESRRALRQSVRPDPVLNH